MATEPLVRPEYGPSLPALLEARAGVSRRTTIIGGLVVVVAVVLLVIVLTANAADTAYVNKGTPVFNVRYSASALQHPRTPGWELVLDSRRGRTFVQSFQVRRLTLPPHRGGLSGYLPLYADAYERALARTMTGFMAVDEGKARVNTAPGYQISYQAKQHGRTVFGRDVLVLPQDVPGAREGAVIRILQTHSAGVHDARFVGTVGAIKKPYRSFRFGTATNN